MSLPMTLLLGFIAGVTILLGLPVGRMRKPAPSMRLLLNAIAVGVLVFLVWDVLSEAWEPVDEALASLHAGHGGLGAAIGYGLLFIAGIASAWARGLSIDCGCFGGGGEIAPGQTQYPRRIAEDVAFALCGLWLVIRPRSLASLDRHLLRRP